MLKLADLVPLSKLLNLEAHCTASRASGSILLCLYKSLSQRGFDVSVSKTIAGLSEYINLGRILTRPRVIPFRQVHLLSTWPSHKLTGSDERYANTWEI